MVDYILKSPLLGENNHCNQALLEVVMGKFFALAAPTYKNFVVESKQFIQNGMDSMDSIMALKGHFGFKHVHNNRFPC